MNEIIKAAAGLQETCEAEGWRYAFIGGLAVLRWGEPRETVDVDLTVLTGFGNEDRFTARLLQRYQPRIADAAGFAAVNRVLLIQADSGVGIDVALGGLPFEEKLIERASPFAFAPGVELRTCTAEDLVVLKTFAGRPKDWMDVEGVLVRQTDRLDWSYVREQLVPLLELKEEPEAWDQLEKLRAKVGG